jgi:hypothetical protein
VYADILSDKQQADSQVLHPGSRKLFRYWESLRAEASCPSRSKLDLAPIRDIVPNLFIIESLKLPARYQFRLAGTALTTMFDRDLTHSDFMSGWDNFERRLVDDVMATAVQKQQPALLRMRLTRRSGAMSGIEMISLPFQTTNGKIQLVGGMFDFGKPHVASDTVVLRELITVRSLWTEHGAGDVLLRSIETRGTPLLRVIQGGQSKL